MHSDDDLQVLIGQKLLRIEAKKGRCGVRSVSSHDTQFLEIGTETGFVTVVSHNVHNGYYAGFNLVITGVSDFRLQKTEMRTKDDGYFPTEKGIIAMLTEHKKPVKAAVLRRQWRPAISLMCQLLASMAKDGVIEKSPEGYQLTKRSITQLH